MDDPDLLARLERATDADPVDADRRLALLAVHARATADAGLRPVVASVQRDLLVRWDDTSSTWTGTDVRTGGPGMVRVLRPHAARDPLLRRQLVRDARALGRVLPDLRHDDEASAIALPLAGPVLTPGPDVGQAGDNALVRLVARTLHHLVRWEQAGLGLPDAVDEELRDAGDHLQLACLTPTPPGDAGPLIARIATLLEAWWQAHREHPVADLLEGLASAPPEAATDAAEACRAALAETLAATRHTLVQSRFLVHAATRRERLARAVAALDIAVDPPAGAAALGVDLDGRTLVVRSDGQQVVWGVPGAEGEVVFDLDDGFDVPAARRLVRVRGSAPVSARLNAEVGGDPLFADRITRWTSAALQLRTVRLMLEATL
ncbi:MAG: hypothetical protein H6733_07415 [Alphaproteobacteria bacterium]|nr:hypothetical protein [Alphaproteobacteria bacterium]